MRQRDAELAKGWVQFVPTLPVDTPGGKQKMGCANAKVYCVSFSLFRHPKQNRSNSG